MKILEDYVMKKTLALTLLMLLVLFNLSAVAQDDDDEIEKDNAEFTFFGGIASPAGDFSDWGGDSLKVASGVDMGLEGGYFFTPSFVTGAGFTYTSFGIDSDNELTTDLSHRLYSPYAYAKYYLPTDGNFVPYVKGTFGVDYIKFTTWINNTDGPRYRQAAYDPAISYSIGLGAFYYTADYSGFFIEGNYRMTASEDVQYRDEAPFGVKAAIMEFHAGFRVLIGSDE